MCTFFFPDCAVFLGHNFPFHFYRLSKKAAAPIIFCPEGIISSRFFCVGCELKIKIDY